VRPPSELAIPPGRPLRRTPPAHREGFSETHTEAERARINRGRLKQILKRRKEADVAIAKLERVLKKEWKPPKRK
jgi:hypothetical protein